LVNPLESYEESEMQQKSRDLLDLQNNGQNDDLEIESNDEVMQMAHDYNLDYMKHTSPP